MNTYTVKALTSTDRAIIERAARNLKADRAGQLTVAERAGIFSVNTEELLEVIERLTGLVSAR